MSANTRAEIKADSHQRTKLRAKNKQHHALTVANKPRAEIDNALEYDDIERLVEAYVAIRFPYRRNGVAA